MTRMTEDQIERCVESRMDSFDHMFMSGRLSQAEYDAKVKELDAWSRQAAKVSQTAARISLYSF